MKKIFVVAIAGLASACACFDCYDEPVKKQEVTYAQPSNCDYFDGKTCYRYVYKQVQRPVAQPVTVRYRPCEYAKSQNEHGMANCGCNNGCAPKITETREPVEIVYKKTTHKTVYEPKTFSQVSYEKAPYSSAADLENVEVIDNEQVLLTEIK